MDLKSQRKMAARVLKCGETRIWFDPARLQDISDAITAADIRRLVKDGVIKKLQKKGVSKVRTRRVKAQKAKGRRKGHGSRKGKATARRGKKVTWMNQIRALRKMLKELKQGGYLSNANYRNLYRKAGGGFFRSKAHMRLYIEQHKMLEKPLPEHSEKKSEKQKEENKKE
ncbi:MAG: 50S ribosomal protein L19e [Candidatus Aenigmarchaeota archaeon ex4484_14]|nr:MAG: 50S ribosomal protein L19e [Candidatus Aenigmarchaeota archaeon ex4484_14]